MEYECEKCGKNWRETICECQSTELVDPPVGLFLGVLVKSCLLWTILGSVIGLIFMPILLVYGVPFWASLVIVGETCMLSSIILNLVVFIKTQ